MRLRDLGEFGLIARIKELVACNSPDVVLGIDDDAAVVRVGRETLVVTTDAFVEDVHFRWEYFQPFDLGWRLMAANLSDIAAMGARPRFAFVDLAVPEDTPVQNVLEFYRGMRELAERHGTWIVGGDTTSAPKRWFLSLAIVGEAANGRFARRSTARVGDVLAVTGYLGSSLAGLRVLSARQPAEADDVAVTRHLRPEPRVREGHFLVAEAGIKAMIDISDGLASEVHHLCRMSGVGAQLRADSVPIHPRTREIAVKMGEDPLTYALGGGEDFELLFCVRPEQWPDLAAEWARRFDVPLTEIGRMVPPERGVKLIVDGREVDLLPQGWQHFQRGS